jgi:hypothetical protein
MTLYVVSPAKNLTQLGKRSFTSVDTVLSFTSSARKVVDATLNGVSSPREILLLSTDDSEQAVRAWASSVNATYVGEIPDLPTYLSLGGWSLFNEIKQPPAFVPVVIPPPSLDLLKAKRIVKIDEKTSSLLMAGYTHNGVLLSTSESAQLKWSGFYAARDVMTYPKTVPSKDNLQFLTLADAASVTSVFEGMASFVASVVDAGTALKQLVVAAATVEELNNIVDSRT